MFKLGVITIYLVYLFCKQHWTIVTRQNVNCRWFCWSYSQLHSLQIMAQWLKITRNTKFLLNHTVNSFFHPFHILFHTVHSLLHCLIYAISCNCFLPYVTKYRQGPSYKYCIYIPYQILVQNHNSNFERGSTFHTFDGWIVWGSWCSLKEGGGGLGKSKYRVHCTCDRMEYVFVNLTTKWSRKYNQPRMPLIVVLFCCLHQWW